MTNMLPIEISNSQYWMGGEGREFVVVFKGGM